MNSVTNKVCIVIPIYKEKPTEWEKASFRQVLKVLSLYDFVIYTHDELDLSVYYDEAVAFNKNLRVEFFNKSYFSSIIGYNKLCLNIDFYRRVESYEYMLIYQLDAWVFRDELLDWCDKGYDYVGAPWFTNFGSYEKGEKLWAVGNGGLSLRRNEFCIKFLSYKLPISFHLDINKGMRLFIRSCLKSVGVRNTIQWYVKHVYKWINEDQIFTVYISSLTKRKVLLPKMPAPKEAAYFSFDQSPSFLYKLCNENLPFGCHAFEKYEYDNFWSKFITL